MRPLIFTLILVAALLGSGAAQAEIKVPFGIKGGISSSTWDWGSKYDVEDNTSYSGWQVGAFIEFDFDFFISIELDALISKRGTKIDQGRDVAKFETGYLEVPLLAKFTIELEYSRPYFILGPSANFLMKAEIKSDEGVEDFKSQMETTEVAMVAGFGIHMKSVLLEGRYNMGMTDINKDGGITSSYWTMNFGITF